MLRFDEIDAYYLANNLTTGQLRQEISHASESMMQRNITLSMPCCLLWSRLYNDLKPDHISYLLNWLSFDYEGYIGVCREALKATPKTMPAIKGKRIDIESLKASLDIVTEIEKYTRLKKSGTNRFLGCCPLHEDKHPSLTVYTDSQSWHCFQCNKGGDIISFIMTTENVDFRQAAVILGGA